MKPPGFETWLNTEWISPFPEVEKHNDFLKFETEKKGRNALTVPEAAASLMTRKTLKATALLVGVPGNCCGNRKDHRVF